jgi:hypothetical protein
LLVVHLTEYYPTHVLHRLTHLLHHFPPLLTYIFLIIVYILTMEDSIILSPSAVLNYKPGEMWETPTRAIVCGMRRDGKSYSKIRKWTGLTRSIIQSIVKGVSSYIIHKGKATKRPMLKQADIKRIFWFVSELWTNYTKSWACKLEDVIEAKGMATVH